MTSNQIWNARTHCDKAFGIFFSLNITLTRFGVHGKQQSRRHSTRRHIKSNYLRVSCHKALQMRRMITEPSTKTNTSKSKPDFKLNWKKKADDIALALCVCCIVSLFLSFVDSKCNLRILYVIVSVNCVVLNRLYRQIIKRNAGNSMMPKFTTPSPAI